MHPQIKTNVVVIGGGPGGYAAAFHAADHGLSVVLVDSDTRLGGVCLNRGCIPSKALLHVAKLIHETQHSAPGGVTFAPPAIDIDGIRAWKDGIIGQLSTGISGLASQRNVMVITGRGILESPTQLRVDREDGQQVIVFDHAIIATGSRPAMPSAFDLGNPRVMTSTDALALANVPKRLLVIGGGYIGMELGTAYQALGSEVTVVEAGATILAGADDDLVRVLRRTVDKAFHAIHTNTSIKGLKSVKGGIEATLVEGDAVTTTCFDGVLVAVGRAPNTQNMGLESVGVALDEKGYIKVTEGYQTTVGSIYAIGDVIGGLLLAHKAGSDAKRAVQSMVGEPMGIQTAIPAVVFTDPEVAWVGVTEADAKRDNRSVVVSKFPWSGSGRALTMNRTDGLTKVVVDAQTQVVVGVGMVGVGAGELIAAGASLVGMGAQTMDVGTIIQAHPTVAETLLEAAESLLGHGVHSPGKHKAPSPEVTTTV